MTTDIAETIARWKGRLERTKMMRVTVYEIEADELTALLSAAEAGIAARLKPETVVCTGCLRVGDPPPPPALSCCPERRAVALGDLIKAYEAGIAARDAALEAK